MITLDALAEKTNHYYKGNPSKNRAPLKKICEIEKGELSALHSMGPVLGIFNMSQYYV